MGAKRPVYFKIPDMEPNSQRQSYRTSRDGYAFILERSDVDKLKAMSEFEGREEPAVAEDFLRFRAESWADVLASAGA